MKYLYLIAVCFLCIQCNQGKKMTTQKVNKIMRSEVVLTDGSTQDLALGDSTKVVYLVRHAEKDTSIAGNPPLTAEGEVRAQSLAEILKSTRIDEIYSTMYTRTLFTAGPTSESKGLDVLPYNGGDLPALVEKINASKSKSFLVVGHSNTTPTLAGLLSNQELEGFDEKIYDDLLIVVLKENNPQLYKLKY